VSKESSIDHLFHVWINNRQRERGQQGLPWEHSLYEWKSMLVELQRLPGWLKKARTDALPTTHQQCSLSEPETIERNVLLCALGQDVTACPILTSLYAAFEDIEPYYQGKGITVDDADPLAAKVCTWHIFTTKLLEQPYLDTSEGYVQDESDRRFWGTVYAHMAASDPEDEEVVS